MRISDATKIPKMLSAKALLIILPLLILVGGVATFALAYASEDPKIKDVVITNVTYNSATVTWETETPVKGRVVVSKASENSFPDLLQKAFNSYLRSEDDRNIEQIETDNIIEYSYNSEIAKDRTIHHVSIRGLEPNTEYVFQIDGSLKTFSNPDYKFTTLENSVSIQDPKTVYGDIQVVYVDEGGVPQQIVTEGIDGVVIYSVEGGFDTKVMSTIIGSDAKWTADISYPYGVYQQNSNEDTIAEFSATVKTQAGKAGISTYDFISPVGGVAQIDTVSVIVEQRSNTSDDISVSAPTSTRGTGGSCSSNGDCSAGLSCCNCITGQKLCSAPGGNCSAICQTTPGTSQEQVRCYVPENGSCVPKTGATCANFVNRYNSENECRANHYNRGTGGACSNDNQCSNNNCCEECGKCGPSSDSNLCSNFCTPSTIIQCFKTEKIPNLPYDQYRCIETQERNSGNVNECQAGAFKFFSDCDSSVKNVNAQKQAEFNQKQGSGSTEIKNDNNFCYVIENNACVTKPKAECESGRFGTYESVGLCNQALAKIPDTQKRCWQINTSGNCVESRDCTSSETFNSKGLCETDILQKSCYVVEISGSIWPDQTASCSLRYFNDHDKTNIWCTNNTNSEQRKFQRGSEGYDNCSSFISEVQRRGAEGIEELVCFKYNPTKNECVGAPISNLRPCNGSTGFYLDRDLCLANSCTKARNNQRQLGNPQQYCRNFEIIDDCRSDSVVAYPRNVVLNQIDTIGPIVYKDQPGIAEQTITIAGSEIALNLVCEKSSSGESWRVNNIDALFNALIANQVVPEQNIPINLNPIQSSILYEETIDTSLFSVSAQPLGPETITPDLLNRGVYKLDIEGYGSAEFTIYADGIKVQYFEDTNGDGIKQEDEQFIDLNQYQIQISKQQELKTYAFNTGWNSVTFNIISENLETASEVVTALSAQGIRVEQISRFDKGQWLHFVVEPTASGVNSTYGTDFKIIPGQGYFIRTLNQGTAYLTGNTFESSVPIALESGWNLIGVQSPTDYTANQFLDICNSQNASCVNISRYDQGVYDSVVIDEGVFFGNNFEIKDSEGYFLLNEGGRVTIRP